ncbi:SDR family NAD(P)-dependent oxidoreductase [Lentzea sokolovensis]|uniref:SDR family NAD(P)-dependent oxidoreductase n=1 Tax=Lentzea sokolovensis TaxID=3095429 RepID=UPI0038738EA9
MRSAGSSAKFALEGLSETLRQEVEPFSVRVLVVEPGAFRTKAYAGFQDEPVRETVDAYTGLVQGVRATFADQDGKQPGDPERGVRAVLGGAAYDAAVAMHESALAELRENEKLSRGADF